jgi:hypothetical protein
MEEAYELENKNTGTNAFVSLTEPFFAAKWFAKNKVGSVLYRFKKHKKKPGYL